MEKKKRGRKPKNAPIEVAIKAGNSDDGDANASASAENTNTNTNTNTNDAAILHADTEIPQIIHISKTIKTIDDTENYEESFCNYNPSVEIPGAYNKQDNFLSIPSDIMNDNVSANNCMTVTNNEWPQQTDVYCFWCCHPFNTTPVGIPVKFTKNTFYCIGNFCSFECAASHNYEITDINTNVWERFNLLNLMASKQDIAIPLKCAKPKSSLKIFGGDMDIDKFRDNSKKLLYFKHTYPMIPLCEQIEELCDSFNTNNTELFTIKKDLKTKQTTIKEFC